GPGRAGVAARLGDGDGRGGEALVGRSVLDRVPDERVVDDGRVVAELVHDPFVVVVGDVVALEEETGVVRVRPQPGAVVVVDVVAGDGRALDLPELASAGAAAAG